MPATSPLFHQAHLTRSIPEHARHLSAKDAHTVLRSLRAEYLDENGTFQPWFVTADASAKSALKDAINQRNHYRKALAQALYGFKGITEFCMPLVQAAVGKAAKVTEGTFVYRLYGLGGTPRGTKFTLSLLQAALHNFTAEEDFGPFSRVQAGPQDPTPLTGFTPQSYAQKCRQLDVGKAYQGHLQSVFDSKTNGVKSAWINAHRSELRVQAWIASMRKEISAQGLAMLLALTSAAETPLTYGGRPAVCRQLKLFGNPVHSVLLIGPIDADQINPCVVYIPGAPIFALKEYSSLQAFKQTFQVNLLIPEYRHFFLGFFVQRLQPRMQKQLKDAVLQKLYDGEIPFEKARTSVHLPLEEVAFLQSSPWRSLHDRFVTKLKADARVLAIPTADVDDEVRRERIEFWLGLGLDALNVVAMFVPALGTVMMPVFAAQLMSSAFHGIEEWEAGDTCAALEEFLSVASTLLIAAGVAVAGSGLHEPAFSDGMLEIELDNGQRRLWRPDLKGYEHDVTLTGTRPNELGQYTLQDQRYLQLEGKTYAIFQDEKLQWRIRHPTDPEAYSPKLYHNQAGAWQMEGEHPLQWNRSRLLRRLGPVAADLSDTERLKALEISGVQEDALRKTQVDHTPPPAMLMDSLKRIHTDNQIEAMITQTRHGTPMQFRNEFPAALLVELEGWPSGGRLEVYRGPELWGDYVSYGHAHGLARRPVKILAADVHRGALAPAVLSELDEQAIEDLVGRQVPRQERVQALQTKLAKHIDTQRSRVFDALYPGTGALTDSWATALKKSWPTLPDEVAREITASPGATIVERTQLEDGRIPLRMAEEARRLQANLRLNRAIEGLYRPSLASIDSDRLAVGLLGKLRGWTGKIRLELREPATGKLLASSGGTAAELRSVRYGQMRYIIEDANGNELATGTDLSAQLLKALPESERTALGYPLGTTGPLREALFNQAINDRAGSGRLLGQQSPRTGFRSPMHLADGRLGYPLSGRPGSTIGQASADSRLAELYPSLSEPQRLDIRNQLQASGDLGQAVQRLEHEFRELDNTLRTWVDSSSTPFMRFSREEIRSQLRNAWRQEGGAERDTLRINSWRLSELPALNARFPHITDLTLDPISSQAPAEFLQCFPNLEGLKLCLTQPSPTPVPSLTQHTRLRTLTLEGLEIENADAVVDALIPPAGEQSSHPLLGLDLGHNRISTLSDRFLAAFPQLLDLNLSRNQLTLTPQEITGLSRLNLDTLNLSLNPIRFDAARADAMSGLSRLRNLHLDHARFEALPDFSQMPLLARLTLSRCAIEQWPASLTAALRVEDAPMRNIDLSNNAISAVPDLSDTPLGRWSNNAGRGRRQLDLRNNPLDAASRERLAHIDVAIVTYAQQPPQPLRAPTPEAFWTRDAPATRTANWQTLFESGSNTNLNNVLERLRDAREASVDRKRLSARVWHVLDRVSADNELRNTVEALAEEFPVTCGDAGADAFSAVEVAIQAHDAYLDAPLSDASGLQNLYRRLYRRHLVEQIAERITVGRLARRSALTQRLTELPALDPVDPITDSELSQYGVDDIEIRLALRQRLATRFEYDEPSRGMLYENIAQLSAEAENNVLTEAKRLETDTSRRINWLIGQPSWLRYLRERYAQAFDTFNEQWAQGSGYLEYRLGEETAAPLLAPPVRTVLDQALPALATDEQGGLVRLTDQQYAHAYKALQVARETAEAQLLQELTTGLEDTPA
ncbi:dermonecrotic toxin domain-containing protein [Pseudomonas tructae]|nr:DUF6543 domain-containing protein [Pseudomonas tructae]